MSDHSNQTAPAILYVGTAVPDAPEFRGPAFSPSGHLFQLNLLNGLAAAGAPPVAVLSQKPQRLFPRDRTILQRGSEVEIPGGCRVRLLPYLNLPILRPVTVGLGVLGAIARGAMRLRPKRPIVCTYNLSEPSAVFTWAGAKLAGAKVVAIVCDVDVPGGLVPATWARRVDYRLQRWLLPRFDALVVVNDRIASDFAPGVPYLRVEGGASPRMFAVERKSRDDSRQGCFKMVAAGSLHDGNGISEMLAAMRLRNERNLRLIIAGDGPLEPLVRQAMAQDSRIEYRGLVSFEEVLELYSEADALLNIRITERIETKYYFPSKLMEYLSSGVPVITTCPGHVREEFSQIAFLLEDESAEGLARLIGSVMAMPPDDRNARGIAARAFMAEHRTWAAQGKRIVEFLKVLFP